MSGMFEAEKKFVDDKTKNEKSREIVLSSFEQDLYETLHPEIIARLVLLEQESKFNQDSRKIRNGVDNVLDFMEKYHATEHPELRLNKNQRVDARIAAILHDIGKSGPARLISEEQKIIVKIFASENIKDGNLLVADIGVGVFPENERENVRQLLQKIGIRSDATMREFWNKHAEWTHDILEQYSQGLSRDARVIAGSHHIDHGINPYGLPIAEAPLPAKMIGVLEDYADALEETVLMAMDQYEARIRRSGSSHEKALAWVKNNLEQFKNDEMLDWVFEAIDELGKRGKIFLKNL